MSKLDEIIKEFKPVTIKDYTICIGLSKLPLNDKKYDFLYREILNSYKNPKLKSFNNKISSIIKETYNWVLYKEQQYKIIQYLWECNYEEAIIYQKEFSNISFKILEDTSFYDSNMDFFNSNIARVLEEKCITKQIETSKLGFITITLGYLLSLEHLPYKDECSKLARKIIKAK